MSDVGPDKKYKCIESTIDLAVSGHKIRLWVNETSLKEIDEVIIEELKKLAGTKRELIDWCADNVPNINAVQVIDGEGKGIVGYTVDFVGDPHG